MCSALAVARRSAWAASACGAGPALLAPTDKARASSSAGGSSGSTRSTRTSVPTMSITMRIAFSLYRTVLGQHGEAALEGHGLASQVLHRDPVGALCVARALRSEEH